MQQFYIIHTSFSAFCNTIHESGFQTLVPLKYSQFTGVRGNAKLEVESVLRKRKKLTIKNAQQTDNKLKFGTKKGAEAKWA